MATALLLDTDLGSDVDDEIALLMLWGSPEVELRAVCTSYGDAVLRTRIAMRMAELAGRELVVAPGERAPWSGAPVWWAGHEGAMYDHLPPYPERRAGAFPEGVRLLVDRADGAHLLAIGPLTSVAAALDAGLGDRVAALTVMGGDWADGNAVEHNIGSDAVAAARVFASGLPTTVCGIDITRRVGFGEAEIEAIGCRGRLGAVVAVEMRAWLRRTGDPLEMPHDAVTALTLLEPQLFAFAEPAAVAVSDGSDGRRPGTVHRLGAPGSVRVVTDLDVDAVRAEVLRRVLAGLG